MRECLLSPPPPGPDTPVVGLGGLSGGVGGVEVRGVLEDGGMTMCAHLARPPPTQAARSQGGA